MKVVLGCLFFTTALFLCRAMLPAGPEAAILLQSKNIEVLKYTLLLDVDLENPLHYYSAIVWIEFKCITETDVVYLSYKELKISQNIIHIDLDTITASGQTHIEITKTYHYDPNKEMYPVTFNNYLQKDGIYQLRLGFNKAAVHPFGPIMRYSYIRENKEKILVVTKSSAVSAKELFFCLEDANMRAHFEVQIRHNEKTKFFTNMPSTIIPPEDNDKTKFFSNMPSEVTPLDSETQLLISNQVDSQGWVKNAFEESNLMPIFSFGFVAGDFKSKDYENQLLPTVIRVSSDGSVVHQMKFAGDMAVQISLFYNDHFKFKYAAKKLDIVALPEYDRIERENYGIISIGESFVLKNPSDKSAGFSEMNIVSTLCDALVYQWIGSQTTTFQLHEHWLSKGLTLFFQANCLNEVYSDKGMKFWKSYIVKSFARVLDVAAEKSTRPLSVSVEKLNLDTLFSDTHLAEKGYLVVRMMNLISVQIESNTFQERLITFFKDHQFVNTSSRAVWEIFGPVKNYNPQLSSANAIKDIIRSWTTKNGLPLVYVRRSKNEISLKQERFTLLGDMFLNLDSTKHWPFPFSFTTKSEKNFDNVDIDHWMETEESSFKPRNKIKSSDWIIYNGNLNVLCRITYQKDNWKLLQKTLLNSSEYHLIAPEARARLIFDMFALAENGKFEDSYKFPLKTIQYLKHEDSHLVWIAAMHEVNKILLKLRDTKELEVFKNYIREILEPVFPKTLRRNDDDDDAKNYRKLIITSACTVGVTECVKQCQKLFNEWMTNVKNGNNFNRIPHYIRGVVSCQGVKHGDRDEWNFLWDEQLKEKNMLVKREYYEALGCTNNLDRLEDYMDYWIDKEEIIQRDFEVVFNSFFSSEDGYLRRKKVFIERLAELIVNHDYRDPHGFQLSTYFVKLLEVTKTRTDKDDLFEAADSRLSRKTRFYEKIKRALLEGSKKVERNILWLKEHLATFSKIPLKI